MKRNRLIAILMSVALLVSLMAACSNNSTNANPEITTTSAESPVSSKTENPGTKQTSFDMFVNMTWFLTDTWTGIIPEAITEKTGVTMNVTRAVDDKQLGLMIASNDLPDIVFTAEELGRLASSQFAYPYNELIEKYTPDWVPNKLQIANATRYNKEGDENYYFLLTAFATSEQWAKAKGVGNQPSIGVRADMLEAIGNPKLETLDDFTAVLGKVKEKYPDTIPYVAEPQATFGNLALRTWFGISNEFFAELNGKTIYYVNHPNYKNYLKYVNNLYRNGYMTADNYSLTDSDSKALFQNGQCFSISHCTDGVIYSMGEMAKKANPASKSKEIALLNDDVKYYNSGTGWAGVVISKNCKDPETAINFMKYMFTPEGMRLSMWGREGVEWTLGNDGLPAFSDEWMAASADANVLNTKYNPNYFLSVDAIVDTEGRVATLPKDYRAVYGEIAKHIYACPWIGAATPKTDSEEKIIFSKLKDMVQNSEVKCFLAESDNEFEKNYEALMSDAKTIGIDKLEAYMNKKVAELKSFYE